MVTKAICEERARDMPASRGWPLVGAVPHLTRHKLEFLSRERERLGDVYRLKLGVGSVVILTQPRHVEHVLVRQARNYVKEGPLWVAIRSLVGEGLATAEGELWRRKRRLIQPQFSHEKLGEFAQLMRAPIEQALGDWGSYADRSQPVDLARELSRLSMQVVVRTLFGAAFSEREADQVSQEMDHVRGHIMLGVLAGVLPRWLPVPGRARYRRAVAHIEDIVGAIIERRRGTGADPGDLIARLITELARSRERPMSSAELRDEAMTMFLTGHETTAQMLAWAVYELSRNAEVQRALRREVDEQLGGEPASLESARRLRYTRAILLEVLRLYTPVYWLARRAVQADCIDGFSVHAGDTVVCVSHAVHQDPGLWERPADFTPERFCAEAGGRPRLASVPFGAGQRQCIGEEFALLEGALVLSRLVQLYELEPVPGRHTTRRVSTTQRPSGGVWVRLRRRQRAAAARA